MSGSGIPPDWQDDPDLAAGEYVLGTLSPDERAAFAEALEARADLRSAVAAWEARLAPLAATIPAVAPDPALWTAIAARIRPAAGAAVDADAVPAHPVAAGDRIVRLERRVRRWRMTAATAAALAAGLALWIAAGGTAALREPPHYLAVVDRGGTLPALIVRVDLRAGVVQVRSLAAETPPERSLELWYIDAGAAPQSLGLVPGETARLPIPAALRTRTETATFAVTVEPKGGAPDGKPTGPAIYSGRLIRD
ncbi:anti-sigma factor [Methylobacterium longum]|jgi:anti-sigma-K factor RskA|uniref:Regulator of SigK n=1 Tax=Methylobacterium longum TaxID=767694 RepID=A0ABT8APV8_9HYPH|nr:anti-sigma factor [Methylobacterium longum]MDN3571944.1 anti-sigma factor [Methylobacterium longum]GJE10924.1 hypothetical protein FOHLNKBM_1961 [Methylobacterium longum]